MTPKLLFLKKKIKQIFLHSHLNQMLENIEK